MPAREVAARIRVLKVIIAVMAGGLFAFTVVVVVLVSSGSIDARLDLALLMMIVLISLAACEAIGYVVLRRNLPAGQDFLAAVRRGVRFTPLLRET